MKNKGFSLIEILITIAIISFLVGTSIVSYRFFEKGTELESAAQNILFTLKLAQTKTLASEDASVYGVHFENNKYILFKGEIYQKGSADNKIYQLPNRLEIHNIDLTNEASSTVFQRIDGKTDQSGVIGLRIISQPDKVKTITIQSFGQIELDANLNECCITNRLADNRHLHLNLGWGIQNSITLTLHFSDVPEKTVDIGMVDYFNPDKTEFDWSETIDVNGQNQELHIHTHFLNEFNTILCIHRDRTENNKPLQLLIDAKDIISYTTEGEISVGVYGGTVEVQ